jgi:D-alanine-D-alanine ligase
MSFNNTSEFFWDLAYQSVNDFLNNQTYKGPYRVLLLAGGPSVESWVSLRSGENLLPSLRNLGHTVEEMNPSTNLEVLQKQIQQTFQGQGPEVVFNALHGYFGEDGSLRTILDHMNIPSTFCSAGTSMLAMDKAWSKMIASAASILSPSGFDMTLEDYKIRTLFYPHIVKPNIGGSSLGIFKVACFEEQESVCKQWKWGNRLVVEQYIPGRELTVGMIGGLLLGITEVAYGGDILEFDGKYHTNQGVHHVVPAPLASHVIQGITEISRSIYKTFRCNGLVRIDFRMDFRGGLYFLELNTQPGMTVTSFVPEMIQAGGFSLDQIIGFLLEDAFVQWNNRLGEISSFLDQKNGKNMECNPVKNAS